MFVYLSKKIAIPNNVRLNCLAWSRDHGYIVLGGDDGLVKVLKLDQASGVSASQTPAANQPTQPPAGVGGIAAPSNLSMNQSLEGHKAAVQVVTWNESMHKLTTSDQDGVIMVWMMYKGAWYEEMTNDRKKSTVKGMSWSADGHKICIVYEDGAIIVGSSDGNRIWGKELRNTVLTGVQWSPDGRLLLFSMRSGEVHLYDNQGVFVMKLNIMCVTLSAKKNWSVVGLHWHHGGGAGNNRPVLVICYENGKLQIMKSENDDLPVIVDTGMLAVQCLWNHVGSVLAVCGTTIDAMKKESNTVMFYSAYGMHLRTLKIPGREISAMSWEGNSLRCAMTVDSFIYFANIRPDYMWCYFNKTVVFVNGSGGDQPGTITFWDTTSNQCYAKSVDIPLAIAASHDFCVLAVELPNASDSKAADLSKYQLLVCNAISTTVDSIYTSIRPQYVAMNSQYVVVASRDHFSLWNYNTPKSSGIGPTSTKHSHSNGKHSGGPTRLPKHVQYHIDDTPSAAIEILNELTDRGTTLSNGDRHPLRPPIVNSTPTSDPICCLAVSEKLLLIARESGIVMEYSMPQIVLRNRHRLAARAFKMAINSNSSRAAIIDTAGVLTTINLVDPAAGGGVGIDAQHEQQMARLGGGSGDGKPVGDIERKDVWAMCWARDNPQLLALMEKTRMYVIRGSDPEEPIACSGYICSFEDLEITGVLLDDLVNGAETPDRSRHVLQLRVKSLRDTEELLAHVGIAEAKQFIEDNSHPRLWRLFARAALKQLDLDAAESAFVRCTNYPGIQLVKRLRAMATTSTSMSSATASSTVVNTVTEKLQRAEVAAFFGDFDEAEQLYLDADRKDLAVELRRTLCDWFRTVQLHRMGPSGMSDQQMETVWREIGVHFASNRSWDAAREYFEKAHDIAGLMESLYQLERYEELEKCVERLPNGDALLGGLGRMLSSVGMCDAAVQAYLKMGDAQAAVETCVGLKQWGQAVELAQKYKMPQIAQLLDKHATQLLQDGRLQEAIALQRKSGRFLDAARLMTKLAEGELQKPAALRNCMRIKKIYVMAGLLTEDHIRGQVAAHAAGGRTRLQVLGQLAPEDAVLVENVWTCALAYHFWMLAQRQLRGGLMHSAVLTSLRLRDYEEILGVENVYQMLAMCSCADRSFGSCSRAFIKLESLDGIADQRRLEYEELAVSIFAQHEPIDTRTERVHCFTCEALVPNFSTTCAQCGSHFPACVASGQPLMVPTEAWQCRVCHHCALPMEMVNRLSCPLCHNAVVSE